MQIIPGWHFKYMTGMCEIWKWRVSIILIWFCENFQWNGINWIIFLTCAYLWSLAVYILRYPTVLIQLVFVDSSQSMLIHLCFWVFIWIYAFCLFCSISKQWVIVSPHLLHIIYCKCIHVKQNLSSYLFFKIIKKKKVKHLTGFV